MMPPIKRPRILLVEDDPSLGATLQERLTKEGYEMTWVRTARDAQRSIELEGASEAPLDLIIFDMGLPDGSGLELSRSLPRKRHIPFIFLTALSDAEHRLLGFEAGAEEYIPKPFHLKELLLRIRHVLESHSQPQEHRCGTRVIRFASLSIHHDDGRIDRLPPRDFKVLELLISRAPSVVSRDEIIDAAWGQEQLPNVRTVDNMIVRLRDLLGDESQALIRSVRGIGYQWVASEKERASP